MNLIVLVFKTPERVVIQYDSSKRRNRLVSPLVIRFEGPVPYTSYKVVLYKYYATTIKYGQEVPLPATTSVVSIVDVIKVTQSDRKNVVVRKKTEGC